MSMPIFIVNLKINKIQIKNFNPLFNPSDNPLFTHAKTRL